MAMGANVCRLADTSMLNSAYSIGFLLAGALVLELDFKGIFEPHPACTWCSVPRRDVSDRDGDPIFVRFTARQKYERNHASLQRRSRPNQPE